MAAAGGTADPRPSSPAGYQKAALGGVFCTTLLDSNWVDILFRCLFHNPSHHQKYLDCYIFSSFPPSKSFAWAEMKPIFTLQ